MPHIKEVLSSEVHWQIAGWNVRDQANARIKQLLGDDAALFAPVYVTHGGYYWAVADIAGWRMITDADESTAMAVHRIIDELRRKAVDRFPSHSSKIAQIFTVPNDNFIFFRNSPNGLEVKITGWGFANFNRAQGGQPIREIEENDLREVTISFNIDSTRMPNREFELLKPSGWIALSTNAEGIYSLGQQKPGENFSVRDVLTGMEHSATIGPETHHIDFDVTEYLTLRVIGQNDGTPIEGERVIFHYGNRAGEAILQDGIAEFRLPWLEGHECRVRLRDQEQTRELDKDTVNVFRFDFLTPQPARTRVEVIVLDNGHPIVSEPVRVEYQGSVRELVTDAAGLAVTEFEIAPDTIVLNPVQAFVREASATETLGYDTVRMVFNFDTPPTVDFNATLLVVNNADQPMAHYPVTVDTGAGPVAYLTDENGKVALLNLRSGSQMTVADGNMPEINEVFNLDYRQNEYVFRIPFDPSDGEADVTLRVIEISGNPAAGVTAILNQDGKRLTAILDERGEMHFNSDYFEDGKEVKVGLYTPRRTFPELKFTFNKKEKEYELVEVSGPTPWWKVAAEIVIALIGAYLLFGFNFVVESFLKSLPNFFA